MILQSGWHRLSVRVPACAYAVVRASRRVFRVAAVPLVSFFVKPMLVSVIAPGEFVRFNSDRANWLLAGLPICNESRVDGWKLSLNASPQPCPNVWLNTASILPLPPPAALDLRFRRTRGALVPCRAGVSSGAME